MAREPLVIGPFAGGLNLFDDPTSVKDTETVECLNWDTGLDGSLRSRPPFQNLNTPMKLGPTGSMQMLGFFYQSGGLVYLIASDGLNTTYAYSNGTWSVATDKFSATAMVQFDNKAWLVAPTSTAAAGGAWTPGGGLVEDANMPHGETIVAYKSRLWISPGRNNSNSTRLYYSKVLGQSNFWATPSFVDIGAGDGQDIVLLSTYYNSLVVFRTQSIYTFSYTADPAQGSVSLLVPGVGLTSKNCLVEFENYLYFMYDDKAYQFINNTAQQINLKVPFSAANTANIALPLSVSLFNNRVIYHYYDTMYVYSLRTRTWTRWKSPQYGAIGQIMSPSGVMVDQAYAMPSAVQPPEAVRRNLFLNPWPHRTASGIAAGGEITLATPADNAGTRVTHTKGATAGNDYLILTLAPVTVGKTYGFRLILKDVSGTLSVNVTFRDDLAGLLTLTQSRVGNVITATGTYTVTSAVTLPRVFIDFLGAGTGEAYTVHTCICEEGATLGAGPYFDGGSAAAGTNNNFYTEYEGAGVGNPSRLVTYRKNPLLFISDETGTAAESFTCVLQTKNFNYQLSSNFKRLFWWGVDAVFRSRVQASAVPVVQRSTVTWGQLRAAGITWGQGLSMTWGAPNGVPYTADSDYNLAGSGPTRKFVKLFKSLRFRQIYFRLAFDTDGSLSSAPVQLFEITAHIGTKETVSKTVS